MTTALVPSECRRPPAASRRMQTSPEIPALVPMPTGSRPRAATPHDRSDTGPERTGAAPPSPQGLTRRAIGGMFWTLSGTGLQAVVQLLVLMALGRLLTPAEFGIMGAATVVVALSQIVSQIGVGPALIQRRELQPIHIRVAATLSFLLGLLLGAVVFVRRPRDRALLSDSRSGAGAAPGGVPLPARRPQHGGEGDPDAGAPLPPLRRPRRRQLPRRVCLRRRAARLAGRGRLGPRVRQPRPGHAARARDVRRRAPLAAAELRPRREP